MFNSFVDINLFKIMVNKVSPQESALFALAQASGRCKLSAQLPHRRHMRYDIFNHFWVRLYCWAFASTLGTLSLNTESWVAVTTTRINGVIKHQAHIAHYVFDCLNCAFFFELVHQLQLDLAAGKVTNFEPSELVVVQRQLNKTIRVAYFFQHVRALDLAIVKLLLNVGNVAVTQLLKSPIPGL